MKIFVLGAGYATRLYPLTRERAKPLLEVGGQAILTRILRRLTGLPEISEVIVISNARFAEAFEDWARDFDPGIRILNDGSTDEDNRLGAIGDLAFALQEVPLDGEDWLVVAGDNLLEFDPSPAYETFRAKGTPLVVVREVEDPDSLRPYNEITLNSAGDVASFVEKPANPQSRLAAIALYFFPCSVAGDVERYLREGGNPDAPGHFMAWLVQHSQVACERLDGRWFDIGSLETLEAARAAFAGERS
ncbi:MAG: nucleotidyltransferase family protein [bacterium]|nr:nucleotidyltransferase family protein [bacterium]